MKTPETNRREFVKLSGAALAVAATQTARSVSAASYAKIPGANDRVRTGVIGFGDRMKDGDIPAFMANAKECNFELVAVSDIWKLKREQGADYLTKLTGNKVEAVQNNDALYARNDIDAVLIATADFQHARHGMEAVRAGRDAYVEKPTAHRMDDARNFLKTVEDSKQVIAVGTQRRSSVAYKNACDYIQSGKFGDIVMVEMSWNVNQPGRWRRPKDVPLLREEDTDWNRYCMGVIKDKFDARKYLEFRLFWPYSSGIPDQWLVHQIDTVHWFTGLPHPRSVVANGGIYLWKDGRTNWDTMTAVFDYGPLDDPSKGFQVQYTSRFTNSAGGVKELYYSNGGMIDMDKQTVTNTGGLSARSADEMKMQPNLLEAKSLGAGEKASTDANTHGDPMTTANMRNWMECVRSRKTPNASIRAGYSHSIALCMNVAAIQTGQKVTFDEKTQQVMVGGKPYEHV
ncbi:MAG TPA: Gfo/Idh/MocA family oxidoreductase [Acidobacteriaceae bacterium]|jgi:predicted dehydrogenase|nr:Gfo/Idh/MocA family oxidoreductase [Acidobacteriaceae bacterium]